MIYLITLFCFLGILQNILLITWVTMEIFRKNKNDAPKGTLFEIVAATDGYIFQSQLNNFCQDKYIISLSFNMSGSTYYALVEYSINKDILRTARNRNTITN